MIARVGIAIALAMLPVPALAQALSCPLPRTIARPFVERVPDDQEPVVKPVTGYVLALSWSPHYCRVHGGNPRDTLQCRTGRFGFVLHGLWPQGEGAEPRWCAFARRLPEPLLRANLCVSPSAQLIQHQWAKHGTCTGASARGYLAASRTLFTKLRFPDMAARRPITAARLRRDMASANPWLPSRAIRIDTVPGNRLSGMRICLGLNLRPTPCAGAPRDTARPLVIAAAGRS